MLGPGLEPRSPRAQRRTLPLRYLEPLVPQGTTNVSYTNHY